MNLGGILWRLHHAHGHCRVSGLHVFRSNTIRFKLSVWWLETGVTSIVTAAYVKVTSEYW